jgi:hypothetical protein
MDIVVVGSVVWLHILLRPYWCVCVCGALFGMRLLSVDIKLRDYLLIEFIPLCEMVKT